MCGQCGWSVCLDDIKQGLLSHSQRPAKRGGQQKSSLDSMPWTFQPWDVSCLCDVCLWIFVTPGPTIWLTIASPHHHLQPYVLVIANFGPLPRPPPPPPQPSKGLKAQQKPRPAHTGGDMPSGIVLGGQTPPPPEPGRSNRACGGCCASASVLAPDLVLNSAVDVSSAVWAVSAFRQLTRP
jgi:hypothetical protein